MQRSQSGIETTQEGNQKAQEMKDRYVLLKHTVMQQRTRWLGEQQVMSKRLVLRVTQKEEPQGKVAGKTFDLAGKDLAHLGKMTKMKGSQKAKFEKVKVWKHWRKRD